MSSNQSAGLEKLRWPEIIVKLRKGQKYSKNFLITIANVNKNLQIFKIIISSKPFHRLKDYPVSLFQALNSFTGSKIQELRI